MTTTQTQAHIGFSLAYVDSDGDTRNADLAARIGSVVVAEFPDGGAYVTVTGFSLKDGYAVLDVKDGEGNARWVYATNVTGCIKF